MAKKTVVRRTAWPVGATQPLGAPIQPSAVYKASGPDQLDDLYEGRTEGFVYARENHPNASVLAQKIDALEGVTGGISVGSGMAAVSCVLLGLLKAGDHVIAGNQLYGQSLQMLKRDLPRFGVTVSFVDPTDAQAVAEAMRPETRLVMIEIVSNPTLRVSDLKGIAVVTKASGALLVVDNTFTTPRALRPAEFGADVVLHSVTKLLAGHSDATLGYVAATDPEVQAQIAAMAITFGFTASPFDCWLGERGLQSFEVRYDRAEANASKIADALAALPGVARVLYPGRPDHPDHARASELLGVRYGNMVSFEIHGGHKEAAALVEAAHNIPFAPTLGDVATLLSHPASSSHRALSEAEREALGITEGVFRLSVGLEDADLLIDELVHAVGQAV